jgi:PncC family amidohydrolase
MTEVISLLRHVSLAERQNTMEDSLAIAVGDALRARGWWLATAESCTGGLVLHRLTNIPGSSGYVLGGVVAYDNRIKQGLLGVGAATLAAHGAVSAETAAEMAQGALVRLGADIAVSITGIAGPGGGTLEKPVGLTYIGAARARGAATVERHVWQGDRLAVKMQSADAALRLLLRLIAD